MNERNTFQSQPLQTLGRYTLVKQIGRGGMGTVWVAEDSLLHRQIALKTLPIQRQGDEEYRQRFLREAHTAATLQHPHILLVHDYGEQVLSDGQSITYIVMPLVSGGTLADQSHSSSSQGTLLPASQALSYLTQAAEAIDYAHDRGIIHRDIKPQICSCARIIGSCSLISASRGSSTTRST